MSPQLQDSHFKLQTTTNSPEETKQLGETLGRQIQTGREVIPVGMEQATAQVYIAVQFTIGKTQITIHIEVEGVALLGTVQSHEQPFQGSTFISFF